MTFAGTAETRGTMKPNRSFFRMMTIRLCVTIVAAAGVSHVSWGAQQLPSSLTPAGPPEYFESIYRDFYENYRFGPSDEIAIRVFGQPDYSLERVKVSPTGHIYHPLVGDIDIASFTVAQLTQKLTQDLSEYILNPRVSVALLNAQSAKIGVLGEVARPGILVLNEPTSVLGAITASGGVADMGSKSNVTLLRQSNDGRLRTVTVNLKRILEGKADPDENLILRSGDTLIVHSNIKRKIGNIMTIGGFTQFLAFLSLAR